MYKYKNSTICEMLLLFILACLMSKLVLSIARLLFDSNETFIMSIFWIIVILFEFFISLPVAKSKQEGVILFLALFVRALYLSYITIGHNMNNPDLTADALGFWQIAEKYYCGDFSSSYTLFPYFIFSEFYIWGKNLFCCLLLNVFLEYLTCIMLLKLLNELNIYKNIRIISLLVVSFLPYSIMQATQLLRESLYSFFIMCSFYFFVNYIVKRTMKSFYYSMGLLIPVLILHIGYFPIILVYMVIMVKISNTQSKSNIINLFIRCLVFLGVVYLLSNFGSTHYIVGSNDNALETILEKISGNSLHRTTLEAGSAYLLNLKLDSWWKIILFSPIKLVYFMFSPLPPYWRGTVDIISFLLDSCIHLWALYCGLKSKQFHINNVNSKTTKEYIIIKCALSAFILSSFVFSLGTTTAGTAIRHRDVFIGVEATIIALYYENRKSADEKRVT